MSDITSNLVIHYNFANISGSSLTDSSGNSHTATLYGSTLPSGTAGPNSITAVQFNGSNYINTNFAWNTTGAVTVAWWHYTATACDCVAFGADEYPLAYNSTTKRLIAWAPSSDGNIYWDCGRHDQTGGRLYGTYGSGNLSAWTHVALTSTGSSNTFQGIYLNGGLAYSKNSSQGNSMSNNITIGAGCSTQYGCPWAYSTGKQADWRLYNRCLSADDVSALYNLGRIFKKSINQLTFF